MVREGDLETVNRRMFTGNPEEMPISETLHSISGEHVAAFGNCSGGSRDICTILLLSVYLGKTPASGPVEMFRLALRWERSVEFRFSPSDLASSRPLPRVL